MHKKSKFEIKKHLEAVGKNYNSITNRKTFQHYLKRRREYLTKFSKDNLQKESLIIDLAAGTGNYSDSLSNYRYLINMDLSFSALKAETVSNSRTIRINADVLHIPLKDNFADMILLIGILHHIPHQLKELFQEISRVLKNGGMVIIDEPNGYNIMWFIYMRLCEIDKIGAKPLFSGVLKRLAKHYCFKIEKESFWGFVPPWPDKKSIIDIFVKIESMIESSFLSFLCTRYLLILRKRIY